MAVIYTVYIYIILHICLLPAGTLNYVEIIGLSLRRPKIMAVDFHDSWLHWPLISVVA